MTMGIRKHNNHPRRTPVTAKTTNKLHYHEAGTMKDTYLWLSWWVHQYQRHITSVHIACLHSTSFSVPRIHCRFILHQPSNDAGVSKCIPIERVEGNILSGGQNNGWCKTTCLRITIMLALWNRNRSTDGSRSAKSCFLTKTLMHQVA